MTQVKDQNPDVAKAVEKKSAIKRIKEAPNCYMCRTLSLYTDKLKCTRCGSSLQ